MYYNGDINNIKTYKKIYNTGMTYKDFLEINNMYEQLQNEISPRFLSSNVFIYKRYPIPVGLTFKDSNYYNSRYYTAYVLNYVSCGFFFASFAGEVVILITDHKIIGYIVKSIFEFGICLFFFLTVGFLGKINVFGDDSELFKENNFHIIQLEIFHIFYFCFAIIKNLGTLFLLYNEYKSNKTYKENKSNEPEGDTKTTELVNEYNIPSDKIHFFTWLITEATANEQNDAANKKVFDCFTFLNEFDVLKLRFELLDPVVDYFVISELELTHQWNEKPLYFKENRSLFEKYAHKIIYICPPRKDYPAKYESTKDHPLKWQAYPCG